jgi:SAM-dependent methyltransferase
MRGDVEQARGRAPGTPTGHGPLSATLLAWLEPVPLHGRTVVVDVGTGTGRLAVRRAGAGARRVLGIDTDAGALVEARRQANRAGLTNVVFIVADAEQVDYRALGQPDVVVAHLCMSDAIIARVGAGLPAEGVLAFAAFHTDQWRETGTVSRFAYEPERARAVLGSSGFRVERLEVEQQVARFSSPQEALAATEGLRSRWEPDGRWAAWQRYVADGGRSLTQSRLVVLARRDAGRAAP